MVVFELQLQNKQDSHAYMRWIRQLATQSLIHALEGTGTARCHGIRLIYRYRIYIARGPRDRQRSGRAAAVGDGQRRTAIFLDMMDSGPAGAELLLYLYHHAQGSQKMPARETAV